MNFNYKNDFVLLMSCLLLFNVLILLDVPFFRQVAGFLFLTIVPGFLILKLLKLDSISFTEKFVLSVGLSISFLIFFGLAFNNLLLNLGYINPLAPKPLIILLNSTLLPFIFFNYRNFKDQFFSIPHLRITTYEKAFLIVPFSLPELSVFGIYLMNSRNNNFLLLILLSLIILYVSLICFFNRKFPIKLYPIIIFLISLSILILLSLRSNYIIGSDTHGEYYYFIETLSHLYWHVYGNTLYDSTLSISLLPVMYTSILKINPEFLFKILYSLLFSITPLVVYVSSKKYIGSSYAFISSIFFMFQSNFLMTAANARTNIAILFFSLIIMTMFSNEIHLVKKKILFIIFLFSVIVSHYSTAYIFFIVSLMTYVGIELTSKKYQSDRNRNITPIIIILFFVLIFLWYSQITEVAFTSGVNFIISTLNELNNLFILDSRSGSVPALLGNNITKKGIPHKIQFLSTWLTFMLIGIGILKLLRNFKEMSLSKLNYNMPDFLQEKFEVEYSFISFSCTGLLFLIIILPYVAGAYGITRLYGFATVILSMFFVIGGITISKILKISPYIVIFIVLIPYFLSISGVTYDLFGYPRSIILNSDGDEFDLMYIHDQESYAAKWMGANINRDLNIYSDLYGGARLVSQAGLNSLDIISSVTDNNTINEGYIYLRYTAVVNGNLLNAQQQWLPISEYYPQLYLEKCKIYENGGSEIYI